MRGAVAAIVNALYDAGIIPACAGSRFKCYRGLFDVVPVAFTYLVVTLDDRFPVKYWGAHELVKAVVDVRQLAR